MPTDHAFRLSTYVTLGLSCLCLGYSEWDLLPEVTIFTVLVIILLGVSFWAEGRFELSIPQANRLGVVIGVLAALWVGWQIVRPTGGLVYTLPWPTSLLPYLGPLLMVLIPAKLFRPKHVDDWWAMQGIGLVAVGLASAMSEDAIFGVLLALYITSGVTSLVLFYFRRTARTMPRPSDSDSLSRVQAVSSQPQMTAQLLRRSLKWAAAAAALAVPAFFLSPRSSESRWQFGSTVMETGFSPGQTIDLTRTGTLKTNPEIAFQVRALKPDGMPKIDLPLDQKWRGVAFREYSNGRWSQSGTQGVVLFSTRSMARWDDRGGPPHLGRGQIRLDYDALSIEQPVLASPVAWEIGESSPVVTLSTGRPWFQTPDGAFAHVPAPDGSVRPYRQYYRPPAEPDLSPPNEMMPQLPENRFLDSATVGWGAVESYLIGVSQHRVRDWARSALDELIRRGQIPAEVKTRARVDPRTLETRIAPNDFETVARAFETYFSSNAEFRYELQLRRQDPSIDPIEDFLINTKSGHCERYATALALSLRSLGIPAIFVLGFRGCEAISPGWYVVRQANTHAWVEVLIPRPVRGSGLDRLPNPPNEVWHWLNLDPTPVEGEDDAATQTAKHWWGAAQQRGADFFDAFIVGYDPDQRAKFFQSLGEHLARAWWLYLALVLGGLAGRWLVRRRFRLGRFTNDPLATSVPWFNEMIAILSRAGLSPRPGQTAREYADGAAAVLKGQESTRDLGDEPCWLVEQYSRFRYAGRSLSRDDESDIATSLSRLRAGLRGQRFDPID